VLFINTKLYSVEKSKYIHKLNEGNKVINLKPKKIGVLGPPNVGKTSILSILKQEYEGIQDIKPTKGVERSFFQLMSDDLVVWDYGGQEIYRDRYLKSAEKYLNDLDFVYYVVDVQANSHQKNIDYLKALYDKIVEYNKEVVFVLVFNKLDPELKNRIQLYEETIEKIPEYKSIIDPTKNKLYYYFTSIFDPLTIITVFSEVLVEAEFRKKIKDILIEELEGFPVKMSFVFSSGWFNIGSNQADDLTYDVMRDFIKELTKNLSTVSNNELTNSVIINDLQVNMARFTVNCEIFYLAIAYEIEKDKLHASITEKIPAILEKVKSVIERFGDIL